MRNITLIALIIGSLTTNLAAQDWYNPLLFSRKIAVDTLHVWTGYYESTHTTELMRDRSIFAGAPLFNPLVGNTNYEGDTYFATVSCAINDAYTAVFMRKDYVTSSEIMMYVYAGKSAKPIDSMIVAYSGGGETPWYTDESYLVDYDGDGSKDLVMNKNFNGMEDGDYVISSRTSIWLWKESSFVKEHLVFDMPTSPGSWYPTYGDLLDAGKYKDTFYGVLLATGEELYAFEAEYELAYAKGLTKPATFEHKGKYYLVSGQYPTKAMAEKVLEHAKKQGFSAAKLIELQNLLD